jgi:hypothetical protein
VDKLIQLQLEVEDQILHKIQVLLLPFLHLLQLAAALRLRAEDQVVAVEEVTEVYQVVQELQVKEIMEGQILAPKPEAVAVLVE